MFVDTCLTQILCFVGESFVTVFVFCGMSLSNKSSSGVSWRAADRQVSIIFDHKLT